jgi:hypothetical protein
MPNERPLAPTLLPQSVTTIGAEPNGPQGDSGEVVGVVRLIGIGGAADPFDTTLDTTQSATRRNSRQPSAKKLA